MGRYYNGSGFQGPGSGIQCIKSLELRRSYIIVAKPAKPGTIFPSPGNHRQTEITGMGGDQGVGKGNP